MANVPVNRDIIDGVCEYRGKSVKHYEENDCKFTASNHRMRYDPEFHENHNTPWSREDIIYLCGMCGHTKKQDLAMALGRTHGTVLSKIHRLKEQGRFEHFKSLFEKE